MSAETEELTFDLLDDVCLGLRDKSLDISVVPAATIIGMGPLCEFQHTFRGVSISDRPDLVVPQKHQSLFSSYLKFKTDIERSSSQGFVLVQDLLDDDLLWTNLTINIKKAAITAGFTNEIGGKIVAAVLELYSNVVEHSQFSDTGYIVYAASENLFEFVVADHGIGVLESLKSNGRFPMLFDHGRALEMAVSENVSRFSETDRGFGFRPIFTGLANLSDLVRFRSGDSAYLWERALDGSIDSKTIQLASLKGLFCYVRCRAFCKAR